MFPSNIFDTEIINDEAKGDGAGFMAEETRGVRAGVVSMGGQVFLEAGVGNDTGLGKPIHAFTDFNQHTVILYNGRQVVLGHDVRGNVPYGNPHVFVPVHGIVQVEILDVERSKFGFRGGDDTVEEELGSGQFGGFGGDIAGVLDPIATTCVADTMLFLFVGLKFGNNPQIGGYAPSGKVGGWNKEDGVGAGWHMGEDTLGEPTNFIGGALEP